MDDIIEECYLHFTPEAIKKIKMLIKKGYSPMAIIEAKSIIKCPSEKDLVDG